MRDLLLLGASGLAREVQAAVGAAGSHRIVGILDDDAARHGSDLAGMPVVGDVLAAVHHPEVQLLLCVGHGSGRRGIAERLTAAGVPAHRYATVVHPAAQVGESCDVGPGSVILAGVVATASVSVGQHVVVMPNVTLTHDVVVGDYATLTAGVSLGGSVVVGEEAYLGMNSAVREGLEVGHRTTLGMGGVLVSDLPCDEVWGGVPARRLRVSGQGQR